ncbi:MAG: type IV pilus assembly protein PilM [Candidatus Paceibacterota bacterium]|jgi:type IV pilus assembly protein PilM
MLESLNLKKEAFGLDVSDLSLKIAKLRKGGSHLKLDSFGSMNIDPGLIKQGEITDEKRVAEIIKASLKNVYGKKIKTKYVIAALPEEKAFLQVIRMPKLSKEDLGSAIAYEAENYIPMPINDVYLDSRILPAMRNCKTEGQEVLLAAIPRKVADGYLSCLKKAGLEPIAFEIESQAISRALIKNDNANEPIAMLDLGESRTIFIVFYGNSIRFTASIPISGYLFRKIVAQDLGVDMDKAETLITRYGIRERMKIKIQNETDPSPETKLVKGEIFQALIPALVDLVQQIKKYMDFYQTHSCQDAPANETKKISKIILCGGGANLKGIDGLLSLELRTPVEIGNPWVNIMGEKDIPDISSEKSLKYATVLGLAIRTLEEK